MIGQSAQAIAGTVGIARAYPIKLIVVPVPVEAVEQGSPFAKEKLAPFLSLFTVRGEDDGFALCRRILAGQGAGHTAIIHTGSPERIDRFGLAMPASRIIVNGPAVQGVSGVTSGLIPSYVLGCGTWGGNSTTDNVTYRNLQNVKRLARFQPPAAGREVSVRRRSPGPSRVTGACQAHCAISHFRDFPWSVICMIFQGIFREAVESPGRKAGMALCVQAGQCSWGVMEMKATLGASAAALIWAMLTVQAPAQSLVAIVEDIHGGPSGIEFMDYVESGKQIQLGQNGKLVLSYLKSCFRETIVGGKVVVGSSFSQVTGGRVDRTQVSCDGGKMQLSYELASKSGASVFRDLHNVDQPPGREQARPQFILHGASPVVEIKRGSKVVIERVDQAGERFEIPGAGRPLLHGKFYDFADDNKQLAAAGHLQGGDRPKEVMFQVDSNAKPGRPRSRAACCGWRPDPGNIGAHMGRIRYREALFAIAVALLAGFGSSSALEVLRGLSIDVLTALRWRTIGQVHDPASSVSVVIGLDEETYRTAPFVGTPNITWTRELGRVMTAVLDGGAKVVGFDMVFPTSIEQSEIPFGDRNAWAGGCAASTAIFEPSHWLPATASSFWGRLTRLATDPAVAGSAHRRRRADQHSRPQFLQRPDTWSAVPLTFMVDGVPTTSMSVELVSRALGVAPDDRRRYDVARRLPDVPGAEHARPQFRRRPRRYSDLFACRSAGVRREGRYRVFLPALLRGQGRDFGTVLDVEDRNITSKRFATGGPEGAQMPRCALPVSFVGEKILRNSISGVYGPRHRRQQPGST